MEWLTCFSDANLMLGSLLLKKFKKFNQSSSFSKTARMSSTYLTSNLGLLRLYLFNQVRFVKTHENISKERSQGRTHGYSINLTITFTVKKKMSR